MRIKICGLTHLDDARYAAELGADALGFVFVPGSPRFIEPQAAAAIIAQLPPLVTAVGVFADALAEAVERALRDCGLGMVQLQGDEPLEICRRLGPGVLKAIHVRDRASLARMRRYVGAVRAFVLDSRSGDQLGGTGRTFDWQLAIEAKAFGPIVLAGGLTPENVALALRQVRPLGVDVSSGVEARVGRKDRDKMRRFIAAARAAAREQEMHGSAQTA